MIQSYFAKPLLTCAASFGRVVTVEILIAPASS